MTIQGKKSPITTHILDTARGVPAAGVEVSLFDAAGVLLATGRTDADGRILDLLSGPVEAGDYRLSFAVAPYLEAHGEAGFYPTVDVSFRMTDPDQHYHVPLLLSPFGYSTYRGS